MTVPIQTPYTEHVATGLATPFPFTFLCLLPGDLDVLLNGALVNPTLYSVSGLQQIAGGTVVFLTPPAAGVRVLIRLAVTASRTTNYPRNGALPASVVNADFDRLWLAMQQAFSQQQGTLRLTYPRTLPPIPEGIPLARRLLGFDANEVPTTYPSNIPDIVEYVEQAEEARDASIAAAAASGASAVTAAARAWDAAQSAQAANLSKLDAQAAQAAAESAQYYAEALNNRWPNTTLGLANTEEGRYFSTPSDVPGEAAIIYLKSGGVAVEETRIANLSALATLVPAVEGGMRILPIDDAANRLFTVVDENGKESFLSARLDTGGPSPAAALLIADTSNAQPSPLNDMLILYDPDSKRYLQVINEDGKLTISPTPLVAQAIADLGNAQPSPLDDLLILHDTISGRYLRVIDGEGNVVAPVPGSVAANRAYELAGGSLFLTTLSTGNRVLITSEGNPRDPRFVGEYLYWDWDGGTLAAAPDGTITIPWSNTMVIIGWGDSLTEGGSPGRPYLSHLQDLLPDVTMVNRGQSGQMSGGIAARQGGITTHVTVDGGLIPAGVTPVAVTLTFSSSGNNYNGGIDGTLAGVPGMLFGGQFTRTTAGAAVAVAPGTLFLPTDANNYRDAVSIFWTGRNDVAFGYPFEVTAPTTATALMVAHLSPIAPRFLVVSVTTANSEGAGTAGYNTVMAQNALLASTYPNNYVDLRRFLIDHGLEVAGITPTTQDLIDIANDTIPISLMADDIHTNDPAKAVEAVFFKLVLDQRGWTQ